MKLLQRLNWDELDISEKLGYIWTLAFAILVISVAATIIIPIYLNPEDDDWDDEDWEDDEDSSRSQIIEYRLAVAPTPEFDAGLKGRVTFIG